MSGFGPKVCENQKQEKVFAAKTLSQISGVMIFHHNMVSSQNNIMTPGVGRPPSDAPDLYSAVSYKVADLKRFTVQSQLTLTLIKSLWFNNMKK